MRGEHRVTDPSQCSRDATDMPRGAAKHSGTHVVRGSIRGWRVSAAGATVSARLTSRQLPWQYYNHLHVFSTSDPDRTGGEGVRQLSQTDISPRSVRADFKAARNQSAECTCTLHEQRGRFSRAGHQCVLYARDTNTNYRGENAS